MPHAQKFSLDPYGETWKTSLSIICSWRDDLPNCLRVVFVPFCKFAFLFTFIYVFVFKFQIRELIGIIIFNYRLVDNWSYNFNQVTSISWYIFFWTDKVHLSSANQVTFCIVQLSPFHFILRIFWHVDSCRS